MRKFGYIGLWVLMLFVFSQNIWAQRIQTISGRIVDKIEKKPFKSDVAVFIFGFYTVAAAEEEFKKLSTPGQTVVSDILTTTDLSGNYEIDLPDNGAIIFQADVSTPIMEKIDGRLEINVQLDAGIQLPEFEKTGLRKQIGPEPPVSGEIDGDKLSASNKFYIPAGNAKKNARLIIQPILVHCATEDTIAFCKPIICDGEEYYLTQDRRKDFNIEENDPLFNYVNKDIKLVSDKMEILWVDTVKLPKPKESYYITADYSLEDYTKVYFHDKSLIVNCKQKRRLRFLEFSFGQRNLNPNEYRERAKRERLNTAGNISLTFVVGKTELDPENPENEVQMKKLQDDLLAIVNGEGTSLKEFHITGISSPEGGYQSNLALSQRRVAYAKQQITSVIPQSMMRKVYQNDSAKVAGWNQVAELVRDTLPELADHIMSIVERAKHPDQQFQQIARLPEYKDVITKTFPKLRTVKYVYQHEVFRELTPEEILDRYEHDMDYRTGKKEFALYEFWHLFNMVKDPMELEALYKRAYDVSAKQNNQPWILAANNLAVSYLKRDTFDTEILKPFIDKATKGVNVIRPLANGIGTETINPEAIVANQLAMCIKADQYEDASIMAQILPDTPENIKIKAFARCLGGHWKKDQNVFDIVKNSSPINEVVMYLAKNTNVYNLMAERSMKKLDSDTALYWYFKAMISYRKQDIYTTQMNLFECFKKDKSFINIFNGDGEFNEEDCAFIMEEWENEKEMMMLN